VLRFRLMVKRGHRCPGPKHQKEKRSMDHFAGLDVSVKDTSICIVDDTGRITREVKVASEPDALLAVLLKLQQTGAYSITSSAWKADYTWGAPRHL
jgi:transposase